MFGVDWVLGSITVITIATVSWGIALSSVLLLLLDVSLFVMVAGHSACSSAFHLSSPPRLILPANRLLLGGIVFLPFSLIPGIPVFTNFPSITLLIIFPLIPLRLLISFVSLGLVVISAIVVSFLPVFFVVSAVAALVVSLVGASVCLVFSTISFSITGLVPFSALFASLLSLSIFLPSLSAVGSLGLSHPLIVSSPSCLPSLPVPVAPVAPVSPVAISVLVIVLPLLPLANQAA